ncbi:MAG TPA: hypothetical protein VND93_28240, partial [Myxococcales bacterium]|nr:hypothetical protein [Myxococcales bacterium]
RQRGRARESGDGGAKRSMPVHAAQDALRVLDAVPRNVREIIPEPELEQEQGRQERVPPQPVEARPPAARGRGEGEQQRQRSESPR